MQIVAIDIQIMFVLTPVTCKKQLPTIAGSGENIPYLPSFVQQFTNEQVVIKVLRCWVVYLNTADKSKKQKWV